MKSHKSRAFGLRACLVCFSVGLLIYLRQTARLPTFLLKELVCHPFRCLFVKARRWTMMAVYHIRAVAMNFFHYYRELSLIYTLDLTDRRPSHFLTRAFSIGIAIAYRRLDKT
jgi:hypothetical protein